MLPKEAHCALSQRIATYICAACGSELHERLRPPSPEAYRFSFSTCHVMEEAPSSDVRSSHMHVHKKNAVGKRGDQTAWWVAEGWRTRWNVENIREVLYTHMWRIHELAVGRILCVNLMRWRYCWSSCLVARRPCLYFSRFVR